MCTQTKIKSISFLVCHRVVEPHRRQRPRRALVQEVKERRRRNIRRRVPPRNSKNTWSNSICSDRAAAIIRRRWAPTSQRITSSSWESHLKTITILQFIKTTTTTTTSNARGQTSHRSRCMSRPTCCRRYRSWILRWSMLTCLRWLSLYYPSLKIKLDALESFPYLLACRLSGISRGSHHVKTTSPLKA